MALAMSKSLGRDIWRRASRPSPFPFRSFIATNHKPNSRFFNSSFRAHSTTPPHETPFAEELRRPRLLRATLFTLGIGGGAHLICAGIATADADLWKERLRPTTPWGRKPNTPEMVMARLREQRDRFKDTLNKIHENTKEWPSISIHLQRMFVVATNSWLISGEAAQMAWKITFLNAAVFLAWRVPRLQGFMQSNFAHNVMSRKSLTLLTSVFSHASPFHLLFNTLALTSFAPSVCNVLYLRQQAEGGLIQDSTPIYHFLAFFLTAGVVSSLTSHVALTLFRVNKLFSSLSDPIKAAAVATAIQSGRPLVPSSLGASGAIYSMIAYTALAIPSASVNIMFIPIAIPISWAVTGTVCLDIVGILRGWRMFDHWAHLGGAGFGLLYYYKGAAIWEELRQSLEGPENQAKTGSFW